jgi:Domain of unknown function (DUF4281)
MSWELAFALTNIWALVGWAMLAFLPRRPAILSAVMFLVIGLLCAAYAVMFAVLLSGSVDPGAAPGASDAPINLTSLAGVMALFDTKAGTTIGWTHYLAFDLFVGLWIARDADAKGIGRLWQLPFLALTLMAGPVGLLLWLAFREPRARAEARRHSSN